MINFLEYQRNYLRKLLKQCSTPQVELFNRMYKSVDEIPEEKIRWAVRQCEQTIKNNKLNK